MSSRTKRILVYLGFVLITLVGPLTVLLNTGFETTNQLELINSLLRTFGLLAFSMLFIQVVLGSNMTWFSNIIGARAYKLHIILAFSVLFLIVLHPLFYSLSLVKSEIAGLLSAFIPSGPFGPDEFYIFLGRISFVALVMVFVAGYFRTKPVLRRNWKKVHNVSLIAFYTISIHSWNIGSDTKSTPFIWFYYLAVFTVSFIVIRDFYIHFKKP